MVSQSPRHRKSLILLGGLVVGAGLNAWALWAGPTRQKFGAIFPHAQASRPPLIEAAARGDGTGVLELISQGHDVNARTADGQTPLLAAAAAGHGQVARLLVASRANPDARDAAGRTAIMLLASHENQVEALRALIAAGASLDEQDRLGQTALTLAVASRRQSHAALLLAAGANPAPTLPAAAAQLVAFESPRHN